MLVLRWLVAELLCPRKTGGRGVRRSGRWGDDPRPSSAHSSVGSAGFSTRGSPTSSGDRGGCRDCRDLRGPGAEAGGARRGLGADEGAGPLGVEGVGSSRAQRRRGPRRRLDVEGAGARRARWFAVARRRGPLKSAEALDVEGVGRRCRVGLRASWTMSSLAACRIGAVTGLGVTQRGGSRSRP